MASQGNQSDGKIFLSDEDIFRKNALQIINKMLELKKKTKKNTTALVEELLHSIFFLGEITVPYFTPRDILMDLEEQVRERFPEPFKQYSSRLPRRSPFSCVLDMIVECIGQKNEEEIKARVQEFILCVCPCAQLDWNGSQEAFITKAREIIWGMLEQNSQTPVLVSQVLHSIFFLGTMKNPPCTPEMILGEKKDEVCKCYPRPFQLYSSEKPIPCVLDKIALLIGQHDEDGMKQLIGCTKKTYLLPTTICISRAGENAVRYYGVSMSSTNNIPRRIMIAASCIGAWDEHVAGAVMTYFCDNDNNGKKHKDENIDGTIKLPENVICEAFNLKNRTKMSPCTSCVNMFSLQNGSEREHIYGNCAEAESLSNLLQNDTEFKRQVQLKNLEMWTPEKKDEAKKKVNDYLRKELEKQEFQWDGKFFSPT